MRWMRFPIEDTVSLLVPVVKLRREGLSFRTMVWCVAWGTTGVHLQGLPPGIWTAWGKEGGQYTFSHAIVAELLHFRFLYARGELPHTHTNRKSIRRRNLCVEESSNAALDIAHCHPHIELHSTERGPSAHRVCAGHQTPIYSNPISSTWSIALHALTFQVLI